MRTGPAVPLVMVVALTTGCLSQIIPAHESMDEAALPAALAARSFEGPAFTQFTTAPFESALKPGAFVSLFVSREAVAAYSAVKADVAAAMNAAAAAPPPFPVGAMIVRAISDAAGKRTGLTVMVKREPGYFPEGGDFFFAVTDLAGRAVMGEDGVEWGRLDSCGDCHRTRASSGYLFGMPHPAK